MKIQWRLPLGSNIITIEPDLPDHESWLYLPEWFFPWIPVIPPFSLHYYFRRLPLGSTGRTWSESCFRRLPEGIPDTNMELFIRLIIKSLLPWNFISCEFKVLHSHHFPLPVSKTMTYSLEVFCAFNHQSFKITWMESTHGYISRGYSFQQRKSVLYSRGLAGRETSLKALILSLVYPPYPPWLLESSCDQHASPAASELRMDKPDLPLPHLMGRLLAGN